MPRIVLELHEGQIVRNLLENGLLDLLRARDVIRVGDRLRIEISDDCRR